jgi:hypothetical protein
MGVGGKKHIELRGLVFKQGPGLWEWLRRNMIKEATRQIQ